MFMCIVTCMLIFCVQNFDCYSGNIHNGDRVSLPRYQEALHQNSREFVAHWLPEKFETLPLQRVFSVYMRTLLFLYAHGALQGRFNWFCGISGEQEYQGRTCPSLSVCVPQGDNCSNRFSGEESCERRRVFTSLTQFTSFLFSLFHTLRLPVGPSREPQGISALSGEFLLKGLHVASGTKCTRSRSRRCRYSLCSLEPLWSVNTCSSWNVQVFI